MQHFLFISFEFCPVIKKLSFDSQELASEFVSHFVDIVVDLVLGLEVFPVQLVFFQSLLFHFFFFFFWFEDVDVIIITIIKSVVWMHIFISWVRLAH